MRGAGARRGPRVARAALGRGSRRHRAAHRVRQRREPDVRARTPPPSRDRGATRARREPRRLVGAVHRRGSAARALGCVGRIARRAVGRRGHPASAAPSGTARRRSDRGLADDRRGGRLRVRLGAARRRSGRRFSRRDRISPARSRRARAPVSRSTHACARRLLVAQGALSVVLLIGAGAFRSQPATTSCRYRSATT